MKIKEFTRNKSIAVVACLCIEMVICCNISGCGNKKGEFLAAAEMAEATEAATSAIGEAGETEGVQSEVATEAPSIFQEDKTICVYVCGEVNAPGVYTFDHGARLCEAIELAGGFTADAGENYWNLAMALTDSQMIYVPTKEEADAYKQLGIDPEGLMLAGHKTGDVAEEERASGNTSQSSGKVNINTADKAALMSIPGIGETRAQSIIDYRSSNGNFQSVSDITRVSGIKGATFAKIEDYITVD